MKTKRNSSLRNLLLIGITLCESIIPSVGLAETSGDFWLEEHRRPLNLPDGISVWRTDFSLGIYAQADAETSGDYRYYPLIWEHAVSDALTIVWSPFPLDWRFRIVRTDKVEVSVEGSLLGAGVSHAKTFVWRPRALSRAKARLSKAWKLQVEFLAQPEISRSSGFDQASWILGGEVLGSYSFVSSLSARAGMGLFYELRAPGARYFFEVPEDDRFGFRVPLLLEGSALLRQDFSLNLRYEFHSIGHGGESGFEAHQFLIRSHFLL